MRMNDMNKLFEQQGFEVKRIYRDGHYIFSITKDNYCLSAIYIYPACTTYYVASRHQKEFVESTIKKFEEDFKERNIMNTYQELLNNLYCADDIFATREMYDLSNLSIPDERRLNNPGIEKVIFNPPATIVIWKDGIKTVVKCGKDDVFDPEKGMAMAICKRFFGNKGAYYKEFKEWLPKEEEVEIKYCSNCKHAYDIMHTGLCFGCAKMWNNTALPDYWAPKEEMEEKK